MLLRRPLHRAKCSGQVPLLDPARVGLGRLGVVTDELDSITASGALTVSEAVAYAVDRTAAGGGLTVSSLRTFAPIWHGFARYSSRACDIDLLIDVDRGLIDRYLDTSTRTGAAPSVATQHLRRAALRCLFSTLRSAGLMVGDPTLDVRLPARAPRGFRPLTTMEVERCRAAAQATLLATREPAVWALAEVGASGMEIGEVAPWDVTGRAVRLVGGTKTDPRQVFLTGWGVRAVRRRLNEAHGGRWLVASGDSVSTHSRRTAALEALRRTMRRAGVIGPGVDPRSVTAWAGQRLYDSSGRIEDVARGLGMRSLDQAAELIELDWRDG